MKNKIFVMFLIALFSVSIIIPSFADDGDIAQTESTPDVVKWQLDSVILRAITQTGIVVYRKVDSNGNPISTINVLFNNNPDDPNTAEDESDKSFTQLINYIQNRITAGDSMKTAIKKAVEIKLGI